MDILRLDQNSLEEFRRLNERVLPVGYSERWYAESVQAGAEGLAMIARVNGVLIGAIRCSSEASMGVYVMTVAVDSEYRRQGIGSILLESIVSVATKMNYRHIYIHVWTENREAIEWYTHRGFIMDKFIPGYYVQFNPPGNAYIMIRPL